MKNGLKKMDAIAERHAYNVYTYSFPMSNPFFSVFIKTLDLAVTTREEYIEVDALYAEYLRCA